jgi:hypothetical protein
LAGIVLDIEFDVKLNAECSGRKLYGDHIWRFLSLNIPIIIGMTDLYLLLHIDIIFDPYSSEMTI